MRSFINKILLSIFTFIRMPQLAHRFCFDLSDTIDKEFWKTGNRAFFSSGKYINGKKHGEFRRYDENGDPKVIEKYNEGVLFSRLHVNMKS
jgi:antitoxin component YwqK of YwqJK toxin-antitoxin module